MTTWRYKKPTREVEIDELPLVAVGQPVDKSNWRDRRSFLREVDPNARRVDRERFSFDLEGYDAFRADDWDFIESDIVLAMLARGEAPPFVTRAFQRLWQADLVLGTNRIIVQFDGALDPSPIADRLEGQPEVLRNRALGVAPNMYKLTLQPGVHPLAYVIQVQEQGILGGMETMFIEPSFLELYDDRGAGSVTLAQIQWQLDKVGAPTAWAHGARGQQVRVAVIDRGMDVDHPDLTFDDNSGYMQTIGEVSDEAVFKRTLADFPARQHGTSCAGMIGARPDNGFIGSGVAPDVELIGLSASKNLTIEQSDLAELISYAVDPATPMPAGSSGLPAPNPGVKIISCSMGRSRAEYREAPVVLVKAIEKVSAVGGLLFWSVTNGNHPISGDEVCRRDDVIAVGQSTKHDDLKPNGYGPELDLVAPGFKVPLTYEEDATELFVVKGTSYAAPCAAAVAAVVWSANPISTGQEVLQWIREKCVKIGTNPYSNGRNDFAGYGRVDALAAVKLAEGHSTPPVGARMAPTSSNISDEAGNRGQSCGDMADKTSRQRSLVPEDGVDTHLMTVLDRLNNKAKENDKLRSSGMNIAKVSDEVAMDEFDLDQQTEIVCGLLTEALGRGVTEGHKKLTFTVVAKARELSYETIRQNIKDNGLDKFPLEETMVCAEWAGRLAAARTYPGSDTTISAINFEKAWKYVRDNQDGTGGAC